MSKVNLEANLTGKFLIWITIKNEIKFDCTHRSCVVNI